MSTLLIALLMAPLLQAEPPVGDPVAGERAYVGKLCQDCHGDNAEGGYGPDLAGGRGLTLDQFKHAIRKPWGRMSAWTEEQLPDADIVNIYAFAKSKPRVAEPGEWHWRRAPASAPFGQQLYMNTFGCGQCHEPEAARVRNILGAYDKDVDFEYFKKQVYSHTDKYPRGGMGNFSKDRHPEATLREIYNWMEGLGHRARVAPLMAIGERQSDKTTYTLSVSNIGIKDKGLAAEDVTIFVRLADGVKVFGATGPGYVGQMPFVKLGMQTALRMAPEATDDTGNVQRPKPDLSGDVVVWKVPRIGAAEELKFSFTLSGTPTPQVQAGFAGSTVRWEKPGRRPAGSPPVMVYRDFRMPDTGDAERITFDNGTCRDGRRLPGSPCSGPIQPIGEIER